MKGFSSRRRAHHGLEAELRSSRPEPRPEFLSALAADLQPRRQRKPSFRVALAGALTVGMIAAFGGLSFAAPPGGSPPGQGGTRPGWGCGDKNHTHTGPPGNQYATNPCKPGSPGNP